MVKNPLISVVIPAYNEEKFLGKALSSLNKQQTKASYEVIVADNNSTDKTAVVARQYGARVVHAKKPGVCSARQVGTEAARGEIIISTDADTEFPLNWLDNFYQALKDPAVVAAGDNPIFMNPPLWGAAYVKTLYWFHHMIFRRYNRAIYISACNTAFRKSAWSGYNVELTQGGDEFDLLKQLKRKGKVIMIDNPVYTSSRRLQKGLFYSLFVTLLTYYVADYWIAKHTGKSFFGSYEPIRAQHKKRKLTLGLQIALAFVFAFALYHAVTASSTVAHAKDLLWQVPGKVRGITHPTNPF